MKKIIKYYEFFQKDGVKKVFANFTWLSILQLVERVSSIIVIPYLLRKVGMEKWGLIAFAQSFVLYFGTLVGYGFHLTGVKDISQNRNSSEAIGKIFYSIFATKIFLLFVSFVVYFSIVLFFKKFRTEILLFTFNFFYIFGYCIYPDWFFQGIEKMKFSTILGSIARITYIFLIFIFIKKQSDYILVPLLNSISVILMGIAGFLLVILNSTIKFYFPKLKDIFYHLRKGWHIFLSQLYLSLYSNSRVFILGVFAKSEIVGNYALAEKIINIMGLPLGILSNAIFPRLSFKFKESIYNFNKIFKSIEFFSVSWALTLCIGGFVFGKFILYIFAGNTYNLIAINSLNILLLALFFNQISVFLTQYFVIIERPFIFSRIYLIASIIGLICLLIMAPLIQYKGIAFASVIFEIGVFLLSNFYLKESTLRNKTFI